MRLQLLSLLAALFPYAFADVQITSPAAGASIPAGQIAVKWASGSGTPALAQLSTCTCSLMIGGNEPLDASNAIPLTTFGSSTLEASALAVTGSVAAAIGPEVTNGYYLKMQCNAAEGGYIINYSDRFTITGMTGSAAAGVKAAAIAAGSSTTGPPTLNAVAAAAPAAVPAAGGAYNIPYNKQEGLTRYAPMQPIPPTKITQKNVTPLFPTSAYTIAKTWLPQASIVTTMTASQTFSVHSMENSASPQSQPSGDMAKFLARWKD